MRLISALLGCCKTKFHLFGGMFGASDKCSATKLRAAIDSALLEIYDRCRTLPTSTPPLRSSPAPDN